jgi:hypothetical protein
LFDEYFATSCGINNVLKEATCRIRREVKALTFLTKHSDKVIDKGEKTAVERQKESIVAIESTINI